MSDDNDDKVRTSFKVESDFMSAVLIAFFLLWQQSGWYRIDCALGVAKACELISAEDEYTKVQP